MIEYIVGGSKFIDRIEPLWNKQRIHHSQISSHFADDYDRLTYSHRKETFCSYGENIFIAVACDKDKDVGYCVASIKNNKGEIDSIYVDSIYRGNKIGASLINLAQKWFYKNEINDIELIVAFGNEKVLDFYEQFNFYPKSIKLVKKFNYISAINKDEIEKIIYKKELDLANRKIENIEDYISKDFIEYSSKGRIINYSEMVEYYKNPSIKNFLFSDFSICKLSNGIVQAKYISKLNQISALRTSLWRLEDGKWKMFFHQGTIK